jgi:hypothetical protein
LKKKVSRKVAETQRKALELLAPEIGKNLTGRSAMIIEWMTYRETVMA